MRFVDKDMIDAQFIEHQPVVFLLLGEQVGEALLTPDFLFFQGFADIAMRIAVRGTGAVAQQLVVLGDLLAQKGPAGTFKQEPAVMRKRCVFFTSDGSNKRQVNSDRSPVANGLTP
jgi:hypothetical protein